jgi:hypothetical protein
MPLIPFLLIADEDFLNRDLEMGIKFDEYSMDKITIK